MKFFFYGTLSHRVQTVRTALLRDKLSKGRPATVKGLLFAIPDKAGVYPALIRGRKHDGAVKGYVYDTMPSFTPGDLAELDRYEDYFPDNPASSEYIRRLIHATAPGGKVERVQAYVYNRTLPDGARALPKGDFVRFLREAKAAAFSG